MKNKIIKILEEPYLIIAKLRKLHILHTYHLLFAKSLNKRDFRTIIDVGANKGEYSSVAKKLFPKVNLITFEPLPIYKDKLRRISSKSFNIALWDHEGKKNIYFNIKKKGSSSFLKYRRLNSEYKKEDMRKIEVERRRFDNLELDFKGPTLLKIDVEGAEYNVLKGFGNKLDEIDIIQLEMNFQDNYKGQSTISEIYDLLKNYGFVGFVQKSLRYYEGYPSHCELFFYKLKNDKKYIDSQK